MLGTPDLDSFISQSRRAIATTVRRDGSPASSMVGYARVDDRLLFSSMVDRLKGRTLSRDPRIVLCVLNPDSPMSFVSVEGTVEIHRDNPEALRQQIFQRWDVLVPADGWSMGREATVRQFGEAGRAVFEVTPTRVSGELR